MGKLIIALLMAFVLIGQAAAADAGPKITVSRITASDTEVKIEWNTNVPTTSIITILDQVRKLENLREFSVTIQGLEPGRKFDFDITACDANVNCRNYKGDFTTSLDKKALPQETAITGMISADFVNQAKSIAMVVFFGLLAVVVLGVVAKTGYSAIASMSDPAEKQLKTAIISAEGLIKTGKKDDAFAHYNNARTLYAQISPAKQAKYYDRLIATYSNLLNHQKAKEAGKLADRYIAGQITKDELERLRDLLV